MIKQKNDKRKLKGNKDPREVIKIEPTDSVNRLNPISKKIETERAYHDMVAVIVLAGNTGKYVRLKNIPAHTATRRVISRTAAG